MVQKPPVEDDYLEHEDRERPGGLSRRMGRALRLLVGFPLYLLDLLGHATGMVFHRWLQPGLQRIVWFFGLLFQLLDNVGHGAVAFLRERIGRPLAVVVWLLGFPLFVISRVVSYLWKFLYVWITSRSYGSLLLGLPAVAGSLAVALAVGLASRMPDSDRLSRYRYAAQKALNKGDSKTAELWLEKAALLDPNHPMHPYGLALVAESEGRLERARLLMRRIAPADDAGYPAAHFWLAADLTRQEGPLLSEDQQALEHHLQQALTEPPYRGQSHLLLAQLYLSRGDVERAIRHSKQVVRGQPELRISLARLYAQQKEMTRARSELEKAAKHFSRLVQDEPDNVPARLLWAESQILLGQLPQAEITLTAGLRATRDPRFTVSLARLYLVQFDHLWKQAPPQRDQALVLLQAAGQLAPEDLVVLDRLYRAAFPAGPDRDQVQQLLRQSVAQRRAAALAHLLLAIMAADEGHLESAAMHYELGFEQGPQMIELLGNLARLLVQTDPPQPDRALWLTEAALQAMPDHPGLQEARGQILANLDRGEQPTDNR